MKSLVNFQHKSKMYHYMKILHQQYQKHIHLLRNLITKHFPDDTVDQTAAP